MLKIIYWLLLDGFFLLALVKFGNEAGGYIFLLIAAVVFFTWELIHSIKLSFHKSSLFDKQEKLKYSTACGTLFTTLFLKADSCLYLQHFTDISADDYKAIVTGYSIAYLDSLQKKPRPMFGLDVIRYGEFTLTEYIAKRDIPKIKEHYKEATNYIKVYLGGTVNEVGYNRLSEIICNHKKLQSDRKKQHDIITADLRILFDTAKTIYSSIHIV